jgi:hypothetical protein
MKKSYDQIRSDINEGKKDVIHFAVPLMWSHVEYASALIARYDYIKANPNTVKNSELKAANSN